MPAMAALTEKPSRRASSACRRCDARSRTRNPMATPTRVRPIVNQMPRSAYPP